MMKTKIAFLTLSPLLIVNFLMPLVAHSSDRSDRELYQLCSRSPFNSRCAGQNIPILLEVRSGVLSNCVLHTGSQIEAGVCKLNQTTTGLTIYREIGEPVALLNNQRGTQAVTIENDRVFSLNQQVWGKTYRLELGFANASEEATQNRTAFLEIIGDDELAAWSKPLLNLPPLSPERLPTGAQTGDVAASVRQLLETKKCVGCNLVGADLQNAKLSKANLEGANLRGANLQGANLQESYLVGANLNQANLTKARLNSANLTLSSLQDATLQEADLTAVNLQGATAQRSNFLGAKLTAPTMMYGINLTDANLQNAKLEGAMLANANLENANLTGADLSDTRLNSSGVVDRYTAGEALANFGAAGLLGVGLGALMQEGVQFVTNLQGANLSRANLTGAKLEDALVTNANFSNANFKDVKLDDTDLTGANLCGATMPDGDRATQGCP
jgi:uncharacterized protein YjbI with pentapeptide repeats